MTSAGAGDDKLRCRNLYQHILDIKPSHRVITTRAFDKKQDNYIPVVNSASCVSKIVGKLCYKGP